ncbi:MAG: hypothetical protein AB7I01_01955 [Gammaproteobacteria bacterium]
MARVSIDLRLRPTRFGFLVRPDNVRKALEIFRTCTCLWGGQYNPIIPYFKRVPSWWEREGYGRESAQQIVSGYLDHFEPDFVVESESGLARDLGLAKEKIIPLSGILHSSDNPDVRGHGLSVFDLYRGLYEKKYQFVVRQKSDIIEAAPASPEYMPFTACVFGDFPRASGLTYFRQAFRDAFEPRNCLIDPETLKGEFNQSLVSAMEVASARIDVRYNERFEPVIFVLDAFESRDLIDFWNLRAVRSSVMPVPKQWVPEMATHLRAFIRRAYRPLPGNSNGVMIKAVVMFARSISTDESKELHAKYMKVNDRDANAIQFWYPPIWRPTPTYTVRATRPTLTAGEKKITADIGPDERNLQFEPLTPEFAEPLGGKCRWANVVRLSSWDASDSMATIFPCDYKTKVPSRIRLGGDLLLSTTEGLVFFPEYIGMSQHWSVPDGSTAISEWLKSKKIHSRLSESGRATQQIIQSLGGFWGVRSIASRGVIDLLDEMARSLSRSLHYKKFSNLIQAATRDDEIWRGGEHETLVERNAVQLGLEVKCSKCGSWSWHAIDQLDYSVTCDLCLQKFKFPSANPGDSSKAKWAYRVVGPFALPRFANGGYAASLAIRFFAEVLRPFDSSRVTWASGQELTWQSDGKKIEADFLVWYQRKRLLDPDYPTNIVFGEAKSLGKDAFKDDDIDRMKALAEEFPGSILVFATLKEASQLAETEIKRIRRLAEWGRHYNRDSRQTRSPVVILTATELFSSADLRSSWKAAGGLRASIGNHEQIDDLSKLADLTQQFYLGMPSYFAWSEAKWKASTRGRRRVGR